MELGHFQNIKEIFELLNKYQVQYLVLRNYENLLKPEMYVDGHGDIDLLCANSQEVVRILNAKTNRKDQSPFKGDGTHYYIYVGDEYVSLDLRYVGDDYYCEKWEKELLERRIIHNGFYVMNENDYFYSLTYHAILQKETLSKEYLHRLLAMAKKQNESLSEQSEIGLICALEIFMRKHSYFYVYPVDSLVPARFHLVDNNLINIKWTRFISHKRHWIKIGIIKMLVSIKHVLQNK